jgi:uncharacterized glyoxalase superfamily protein PhnB
LSSLKEHRLPRVIPILRSFDETLARSFYVTFLGGRETFSHRFDDDAPLYLGIEIESAELHLSEHFGDATPGSAVRIGLNDLTGFHRALSARPYRFARPAIENQPWGDQLSINDPFGNRLIFFQTAQTTEAET